MDLTGLSVITIIGFVMAVTGTAGLIYYIVRFRRTRRQFEEGERDDPDTPPNTFASLFLLNGLLHIGMLLLILGGVGLIYYGQG